METSGLEMGTRWGLQNPSSEEDIMHCDFFIKTFIKSSTFLSRIGDSPRRPPRAINHPTDIKVQGPVGARPLPHYYYNYNCNYNYNNYYYYYHHYYYYYYYHYHYHHYLPPTTYALLLPTTY